MLVGLLILTLFISSSNAGKLTNFIRYLETTEKFSFVNLMLLSNQSNGEDFSKDIVTPKMIIGDADIPLKLISDSKIISIVLVDDYQSLGAVAWSLFLNENSKIVIISSTISAEITLKMLRSKFFVNTIFVNPNDFEESSIFYGFEMFPEFKLKINNFEKSKNIFPAKVNNIFGYPVKVGFYHSLAAAHEVVDRKNNQTVYMGFLGRFYTSFVEFINGTFYVTNTTADFITATFTPELYRTKMTNKMAFQGLTNLLEHSALYIIVPSPEKLNRKFYPFKPFTPEIWLIIVGLLIYNAFFLTFVRRTTHHVDATQIFWYYFGNIQRALFAQPYFYSEPARNFMKIHVLIILLGFILTTWYNALLGSFLTTTLTETPIRSVEEFASKNLTIMMVDVIFDSVKRRKQFKKYLPYSRKNINLTVSNMEQFNKKYAYLISKATWNSFYVPQMNFYRDNRFTILEKISNGPSFMLHAGNSVYKERLNRFIYLTFDTGLYKHWHDHFFLDYLKYKPFDTFLEFTVDSPIQPIESEYFLHAYGFLAAGLFAGLVAFIGENLMSYFKIKSRKKVDKKVKTRSRSCTIF